MRLTITGATGLIGPAVIDAILDSATATNEELTVLSRDPEKAGRVLGVEAQHWDPMAGPPPASALEGRDAVLHLAGEPVAQRWTARAKRAIRDSRQIGTRHLVEGLRTLPSPPRALISASAIGIYGSRSIQPLDEDAALGRDFLADTCALWEAEARAASQIGMRVVTVRTGVVLDARGGALAKMLPPFKLGLGGPVAGGRQFVSWVHLDDVAGIYLSALTSEKWRGPVNATAPAPVTNSQFSRLLGRALGRPAIMPVPGAALRLLYGEMSEIVTTGQWVLPAKALVFGYGFRHPELEEALKDVLSRQ